jgi:hypothetical protein
MRIDRHNYEEYFILYMDNELDADDRRMVEAFAQLHPDLKEELELLLHYKLIPDTDVMFTGKEELLKLNGESIITASDCEEWFTLYIDNELTSAQKKLVEQFIANHPSLKKELDNMQRAKLQPEQVAFPDKESLYRKEEKVRPLVPRWWRVAAAAILILGIGVATYSVLNKKPGNTKNDIAKDTDQNNSIQNPVAPKQQNTAGINSPAENTAPDISSEKKNNDADKTARPDNTLAESKNERIVNDKKSGDPVIINKDEPVIAENKNDKPSNNLPEPEDNPYLRKPSQNNDVTGIGDKKALTDNDVTLPVSKPSDYINAKSTTPGDESFAETDGKKNKLRGLFRKVTRTFEKRTDIEATDDDERLLVAGLAIKLK